MTRSRGRLGVWLLIGVMFSGTSSLPAWAQDEVERYWSKAEQDTRQARQAEQQQETLKQQASPAASGATSHELPAGSIAGTAPDAQAFQQTTTMNRGFLTGGSPSMNQPMGGDVAAQGAPMGLMGMREGGVSTNEGPPSSQSGQAAPASLETGGQPSSSMSGMSMTGAMPSGEGLSHDASNPMMNGSREGGAGSSAMPPSTQSLSPGEMSGGGLQGHVEQFQAPPQGMSGSGEGASQGQDVFQPPGGGFGMPSLSSSSELRATEPSGSMPEQLNRLGVTDTSGQPLGRIGAQQGAGEIPGDAHSLLKTQQPSPLEMRGGSGPSDATSGSWTNQNVPSSQQGLLLNQQGSAGGSQMPSAGSAGQGMRQEGQGGGGAQGQSPSGLTPGIAVGAEVRQGGNAPSGGGSGGRRH